MSMQNEPAPKRRSIFVLWILSLVFGGLLAFASSHMPQGVGHAIAGIGAVVFFGGALAMMGLYLGWLLTQLGRSTRNWIASKFQR
jgi:hypothetical protein